MEGVFIMDSKKRRQRDYTLRSRYSITLEQFEEMLHKQGYRCLICECKVKLELFGVDHCHVTGKVRGILCRACNAGLGHFKDNPKVVARALLYLLDNE